MNAIVIEPKNTANAAIIWLHGLGANGNDFVPICQQLNLPEEIQARFIFPHAPERPVTVNGGFVMPAWYDILSLDRGSREDEPGIRQSEDLIINFIKQQEATGINSDRIILGGFSQGGAMALHTGLRFPRKLAGIIGLSCYLPMANKLSAEVSLTNKQTPILMAHGQADLVVPIEFANASRGYLEQLNYSLTWHSYGMDHSVCQQEIDDISHWLKQSLTN